MGDIRHKLLTVLKKLLRKLILASGILFLVLLIVSFTRIPYDIQRWLGTHKSGYKFYPDVIVVMGGSGMPSEANLIRLFYASELSGKYPQSAILIVHPPEKDVVEAMQNELVIRGIDPAKIRAEKSGTNTHNQVLSIAKNHPELLTGHLLIITSPESMLRTVGTFRKAGFRSVGGHSAYEVPMFTDLKYDFKKSGGKIYSPDVSDNLALRYNFWNYLKLEISCIREFVALGYYKLNGWM